MSGIELAGEAIAARGVIIKGGRGSWWMATVEAPSQRAVEVV